MRAGTVGLLLVVFGAAGVAAQDSQFGIRAPGTPGKPESVRARSTGGAFALFDPLSPFSEAALADIGRLAAGAVGTATFRTADLGGVSSSLRTPSFPLLTIGGPVGKRFFVGGGFSTYLDRSYQVVVKDSALLRGVEERYTDRFLSNGGISDLRVAAAMRISPRVAIGVAAHLITGSTLSTTSRTWADSTLYQSATESGTEQYDGAGISASVLLDPTAHLRLAGFARTDTRLATKVKGTTTNTVGLPASLGAAVLWQPSPEARVGAGVTWRGWKSGLSAGQTGGLGAGGGAANAFNTVNWSLGAELGGDKLPLRVGVRGGQMPFGPDASAPTESGFSVGTGRSFAEGRAHIDVGVERLSRSGGGLTEHLWTFLAGLTVRP
ncbi:MAG TPA: hypothetical protein VFK78_09735 [Gemmatimonadales bacterium]|nr:hypothetical protein [Gemmatimonadales bacterium]